MQFFSKTFNGYTGPTKVFFMSSEGKKDQLIPSLS